MLKRPILLWKRLCSQLQELLPQSDRRVMTLPEFQDAVSRIPFGKRLPGATYVYLGKNTLDGAVPKPLVDLLVLLRDDFKIGPEYNVIKFRNNELKISFLSYRDFFENPHPELELAATIDLVTNRIRRTNYAENLNPPILHRKELFLPVGHPHRDVFAALTAAEEAAGLYEETATIGFKLNWDRLLAAKDLELNGHTICPRSADTVAIPPLLPVVNRYKTALTRYDLSKPIKTLFEYGLLKSGDSVFDYGCGQGSDVRGLTALGTDAWGWDPVHRPDGPRREADIVNLGFVLNVIEDPVERIETLVKAYRLARRILVVGALIHETVDSGRASAFRDGVLTQRNTFQKFFEQHELQQYIEDALDCTAVPAALGVFYVFRNPAHQQDFLFARNRRPIDWNQISARLGLGAPGSLWKALYDEHRELLEPFGQLAMQLGRLPVDAEFGRLSELTALLGSPRRALRAFVEGGGVENVDWEMIQVRLGIGQPVKRRWELLYEGNQELLDAYWNTVLQLGRLPEADEFPLWAKLREQIGTPKQAFRLFVQKGGSAEFKRATEERGRDLLVYVALANLRKRIPFGHLSASLRTDIRAFFGNYTRALEKGIELLYAAGDPGEVEIACDGLDLGWQDSQALYFHRSLLGALPTVLRAYVGCATAIFGDVAQVDVIKLHKSSGKATFLIYDDFDGKALPELRQRIKVNLRTRWVQVFDHSADGQLLFYKERLLSASDPRQEQLLAYSAKLRKLGIPEAFGVPPYREEFTQILDKAGLNQNLNHRRRTSRL